MEENTAQKVLYANTTQVSNFVVDNLNLFTGNEVKVILFITRKTIGWHKETDFIRYSQLKEGTGINSKTTLSEVVNHLVDMGLIIRTDKKGVVFKDIPQGYRDEIYYTLNKDFTPDWSKKWTSTGPKNGPYITHSLHNSNTLPKGNGASPKGLESLRSILEEKGIKPKAQENQDSKVNTEHQHYGLLICDVLELDPRHRGRVIGFIKKTGNGYALHKKVNELLVNQKFLELSQERRISYLFSAYKKSL